MVSEHARSLTSGVRPWLQSASVSATGPPAAALTTKHASPNLFLILSPLAAIGKRICDGPARRRADDKARKPNSFHHPCPLEDCRPSPWKREPHETLVVPGACDRIDGNQWEGCRPSTKDPMAAVRWPS